MNVAIELVAPLKLTDGPLTCCQEKERGSSSGSEDALPVRVTTSFFRTDWSGPGSAAGRRLRTVTTSASVPLLPSLSRTVRVNPYVPALVGVNVALAVVSPERVTAGPLTCSH